ncbi:hypothetical protein EON79_04285 [bacterium]|nr:MAG: hypothetical protein EON79_04285 [bacterium]
MRAADWAGDWVGGAGVRPGREDDLAPLERKRLERDREVFALQLRSDGTFLHKKTVEGLWIFEHGRLSLHPQRFLGKTLIEQRTACEIAEKEFRFAFVYDEWYLEPCPEGLCVPGDGVITTIYKRE